MSCWALTADQVERLAQVVLVLGVLGALAGMFAWEVLRGVARVVGAWVRRRGASRPFDQRVRAKLVFHERVVRVLRARIEREAMRRFLEGEAQ